jgi:hypothetical protein
MNLLRTWVIFSVCVVLPISAACGPPKAFKHEYERFQAVKVGWTEEMVKDHLGTPLKIYQRDTAPENYYLGGHAHKKRPITNKVWIYQASEPVAYIYFGTDDRVEEVFVGGS